MKLGVGVAEVIKGVNIIRIKAKGLLKVFACQIIFFHIKKGHACNIPEGRIIRGKLYALVAVIKGCQIILVVYTKSTKGIQNIQLFRGNLVGFF